jgi:transcriptional regulator with XRE-family HTH domain
VDAEVEAIVRAVGANLRREREARGMSQDQLALEAGVHRTQPGAIENARREPRASTLVKLSRGLGIPPGKLFDGIE